MCARFTLYLLLIPLAVCWACGRNNIDVIENDTSTLNQNSNNNTPTTPQQPQNANAQAETGTHLGWEETELDKHFRSMAACVHLKKGADMKFPTATEILKNYAADALKPEINLPLPFTRSDLYPSATWIERGSDSSKSLVYSFNLIIAQNKNWKDHEHGRFFFPAVDTDTCCEVNDPAPTTVTTAKLLFIGEITVNIDAASESCALTITFKN